MGAAARSIPQNSPNPRPTPGGRKPPAAASRAQAGTHSYRRTGFLSRRPAAYGEDGPADHYVRIPHFFWGLLGACREDPSTGKRDASVMSGLPQVALLGYIASRTVGHEDKSQFVWIAISELSRELRFDQRTIERVLADSIARGLLVVKKDGQRRGYRAAMENWAEAPPYIAADAPEPEEDDDEDEDEEDDEAPRAALEATAPLAVQPGTRTQPIPFRAVGTPQGAVNLSLEYRSTASAAFAISASCASKGRICITIHDVHKALGVNGLDAKAPVRNLRQPNRRTEGEQTQSTVADSNGYRDLVNSLLREYWNRGPDADLVSRVISAANGAPLHEFEAIVDQTRGKLEADRTNRVRKFTPGILVKFAEQAAEAWREGAGERDKAKAAGLVAAIAACGGEAALREWATKHPRDYERTARFKLERDRETWPTLEDLGVRRAS